MQDISSVDPSGFHDAMVLGDDGNDCNRINKQNWRHNNKRYGEIETHRFMAAVIRKHDVLPSAGDGKKSMSLKRASLQARPSGITSAS